MDRLKNKKKKGVTLVELMVSMSIFTVVTSLAIGAFVTILNMRVMAGNMKNTQQKVRVAVETITRMAKQAEKVELTGPSKDQTLTLYFNLSDAPTAVRFSTKWVIDHEDVLYSRCDNIIPGSISGYICGTSDAKWEVPLDLFGGEDAIKITDDPPGATSFGIEGTYPPKLVFKLQGKILPHNISKAYYNDEIDIETKVILENIK